MTLSQKCQYALRAMYEITLREDDWPIKSSEIAEAQAIPPRFLENILAQLKQVGLVDSRRGKFGGYMLPDPDSETTVGEVIRLIQGPLAPVHCMVQGPGSCELYGDCPFQGMWERAQEAAVGVYDETTFSDLIREHQSSE